MRPNLNNLSGEKEALSLLELNTRIRGALSRAFPETCWVRAEMSDVRVNTSSGHCYLEFVEKNVQTGQLVAKVRGSIWAKTFRMLKPYFEMETGQMFASGLKVLVKVSVEFHELYGLRAAGSFSLDTEAGSSEGLLCELGFAVFCSTPEDMLPFTEASFSLSFSAFEEG